MQRDRVECLTMLNPKVQAWTGAGGGRSPDAMTWEDVAAALAMPRRTANGQLVKLSAPAYLWARWYFAGCTRSATEFMQMRDWLAARAFRTMPGNDARVEAIQQRARMAIDMAIITIKRSIQRRSCSHCQGTGKVKAPEWSKSREPIDCKRCDGHGVREVSARECARWAGVPWSTYGDNWQPVINRLCSDVEQLQGEIENHLRHLLRPVENKIA